MQFHEKPPRISKSSLPRSRDLMMTAVEAAPFQPRAPRRGRRPQPLSKLYESSRTIQFTDSHSSNRHAQDRDRGQLRCVSVIHERLVDESLKKNPSVASISASSRGGVQGGPCLHGLQGWVPAGARGRSLARRPAEDEPNASTTLRF